MCTTILRTLYYGTQWLHHECSCGSSNVSATLDFGRYTSMLSILTSQSSRWTRSYPFQVSTIAATGLAVFGIYQLVRRFGWNGALLYIWEGDPLPQDIRELVRTLSEASNSLHELEAAVSTLEDGLERARSDCIDDISPATVLRIWMLNLPISLQDIRKTLSTISYKLDSIASRIDQIPSKIEVKQNKKTLSGSVVSLMSRTDCLIEFFTAATVD